jgi:Na+/H+ antiporter NhaD/arsenite permease-like protein
LGSFITEPAAMTVTALLLLRYFYHRKISTKLMYATLGLLFVNVSIGGTLTPFAAPPILMVAGKWNWDFSFMMGNFGWKGALACGLSASLVAFRFRQELSRLKLPKDDIESRGTPLGVTLLHVLFLVLIVASAHEMVVFIGLLFFFIGLVNVTRSYQNELLLRNGLLVAFFLGGLVVLGTPQSWWLEKVLTSIDSWALYLGAMGLTAFTDNAALTYLGAQVPALTDASRYALVAGSVVGGGLTVIANAPNPAGYGILDETFGKEGISPLGLFLSAVPPTLIAALCFWFL